MVVGFTVTINHFQGGISREFSVDVNRVYTHHQDQCILKERPASGGRSWMWHRLRSTGLCKASLRYGG